MNDATYQKWRALHDRWAHGETLTPEEQAAYEAGCEELDAEETFPGQWNVLKTLRDRANELEAQFARVQKEDEALRAQIAALEARFSEPTRRRLGISNN